MDTSQELPFDFLSEEHPVYKRCRVEWEQNERRMAGGRDVLEELAPFDWERDSSGTVKPVFKKDGTFDERSTTQLAAFLDGRRSRGVTNPNYLDRKARASYLNFPLRTATQYTGAIMREAPEVDVNLSLGTLGRVSPAEGEGRASQNNAASVFNSIDAPHGGAAFYAWVQAVAMRCMATGHRWIFCEAPEAAEWYRRNRGSGVPERPTQQDVLDGYRPYLVELSPLQVPNWELDADGLLQFCIVLHEERVFSREGGRLTAKFVTRYQLWVRAGYAELGDEYSSGGWWRFDENRKPLRRDGEQESGPLPNGRDIPAFVAYYQREKQRPGGPPTMSRPGLTEVGQIAVAHMDLDSAADYDARVSGSRRMFIAGVSMSQHEAVGDQVDQGSRIVAIPAEMGTRPTIYDSGSVSAAKTLSERQVEKREQAALAAAEEATWAPDSSAESKNAGYRDVKSPRLALFAEEIEATMTNAIHLLEIGFGADEPTGHATLPRDFDLAPLVQDILEAFEVLDASGASSADLSARMVMGYLKSKGLLAALKADEVLAIEEELRESLAQKRAERERGEDVANELLNGGGGNPPALPEEEEGEEA